jgi:hypothetical protein
VYDASPPQRAHGSSLHGLAHSIVAEYLKDPELKYTLPVYLSETCHSQQESRPLTVQSLCEALGISNESLLDKAFATHAPGKQRVRFLLLIMSLWTLSIWFGNQSSFYTGRLYVNGIPRHADLAGGQDSFLLGLLRAMREVYGNTGSHRHDDSSQVKQAS